MRTPDFLIFARWTAPVEPPGVVLEDHVLGVRNGLIAGLLPRAEAEGPHLSKEFVRAGTELALVEMVRSGTTCFADMYFFPETGLETALQRRVRVAAGLPSGGLSNGLGGGPEAILAQERGGVSSLPGSARDLLHDCASCALYRG